VVACRDGLEALEAYEKHSARIRLVVTDAIMPNLGGRGLYDELHPRDPGLCFLFCSGYASGTLPPEFFDDPTRELIAKPFGHDELLLKVRALLDRG
jgi:DNA-binding NtrC family response regulator